MSSARPFPPRRSIPPGAAAMSGSAPGAAGSGLSGAPADGSGRGELGAAGRSVATVCLIVVLAGLGLAVATNSSSGSSALLRVLHGRLFSPWMTPLWLDLGHDTRLTYGLPEDADHFLEIAPAAGSARGTRVPAEGDRSGQAARWRRLARAAALAEEEGADRAGILSTAIGAGLLDAAGEEDVVVRFMRAIPPERELAGHSPRVETIHQGRVRRVDGEIQWIPLPPAEEVAPLVRGDGEAGR